MFFDVVEYLDPTGEVMVARVPGSGSGDFTTGSQLVVQENQVAVFYRDGQMADQFKAGRYTLTIEGLNVSIDLWLNGTASAAFAVRPEPSEKLPHVLLLGRMMGHRENFLALTRYVAHFDAVVTFDAQEAADAAHVILVGAPHLVSVEIEQELRQAGVRVERVQGDIAAHLDQAVAAGTPFLRP